VTVTVVVGLAEGARVGVNVGLGVTDGDGVTPPALTLLTLLVGLVSSVHKARIRVSAEKMRNGT
jgi:hypothetical protein